MQIVDRRLNPKAKSLGNRQRFLRRAKAEIREAIKDSLKTRKVSEAEGAEKVTIRSKSLREPSFSHEPQHRRARLRAAGQRGIQGRRRDPQAARAAAGRGSQGSPDGEGQDEFTFTLTQGRVPRPVLRRPQAAEPDQGEAQGPEGAEDWRAPASPPTARRPGSTAPAPCARAWGAAWRCAGRARPKSSAWRRSWRPPRPRTPQSAAKIAALRAALEHKAAAAGAASPTSTPSTCSTTASSGCPSRPRRR